MDQRRTDTREHIQTVALEMFAEHGYDGTSLRQIAERLGVTKAAVYYHFKSKEDILAGLVQDYLHQLDALIAWAGEQPSGPATRKELLHRYSALLSGPTTHLTRLMQEGQAAIRDLAAGADIRKRFGRLADLLAAPETTLDHALRARAALTTLHIGAFMPLEVDAGERERRNAALRIAIELTT
jgi:AcrR family transcriptional regulator